MKALTAFCIWLWGLLKKAQAKLADLWVGLWDWDVQRRAPEEELVEEVYEEKPPELVYQGPVRSTPGMVPMPTGIALTRVTEEQAKASVAAMKGQLLQPGAYTGWARVEQLVLRVGGDNERLADDLNALAKATGEEIFALVDEELEDVAKFWTKHQGLRPILAADVLDKIRRQQKFRLDVQAAWAHLDPLEQMTFLRDAGDRGI